MWNFIKFLINFISCKRDDEQDTIDFYILPYEDKETFRRRLWIERQIAKNAEQC